MSVHTRTRRTKVGYSKKKNDRREKSLPWREAFKELIQNHSEVGLILKGCRSRDGVTQKELAKALHISQHHISEMENGKRPIGKEMAKRFAEFFKTDYRVFL
jgi:DNA-binding XRE family transcriptional regulator